MTTPTCTCTHNCMATTAAEDAIDFCPLHAAAPIMRDWLQAAYDEAVERSERDGDVAYWNQGGDGYKLVEGIAAILRDVEPPQ